MKSSFYNETRRLVLRACFGLLIWAMLRPAAFGGAAPSVAPGPSAAATASASPVPAAAPEAGVSSVLETSSVDSAADFDADLGVGGAPPPAGRGRFSRRQQLASGEAIVAIEVNGDLVQDFAQVFRNGKGQYFANADVFSAGRLPLPHVQPIQVQGTTYYPLDAIPGITYRLDAAQQRLILSVPPSAFATTVKVLGVGMHEKATSPDPGFFLNQDLQASGSNGTQSVSGLEELGFFSNSGVFTTQYLGRDLTGHPAGIRLNSQFVRDFPERMTTLTIGDSYSAISPWGQVVNYGGVRWASKFAIQPTFVPFALPAVAGQATQPSTVDLYVNNVLASRQTVDPGPFAIRDIPAIAPQGDVRMVVTDMMGRQQIVSVPFISTPQLLRKGINDYTYEAGSLRNGFGLTSFGYTSWFLEGTQRHGITDSLTVNWRGEIQAARQTFGAGLDKGILPIGLLGGGAAISRDDKGNAGGLVYAHLQHTTLAFTFSASAQATTANFQQLGLTPGQHATRFIGQAQIGRPIGRRVSVSVAYLRQEKPSFPVYDRNGQLLSRFSTITPGINISLPNGAALLLSGYYAPELKQRASASLSLLIPLGPRRSLVASTGYDQGKTSPAVEYSQQAPVGPGWGYRLRTSSTDDIQQPRIDAGATYQSSMGTYQLEAGQQSGLPASWRFEYSGSAVFLRRRLELSRPLTDGFALVDASGIPGIKVLANNQYVATTDRHGIALLPNLPAYHPNLIALDDNSVPLDLDVDFGQKVVVPMPRSGTFVAFKAKRNEGVLLKLVTEDGVDVPVGAEAIVNGGQNTYQVVLRGELFVPEISYPASIRVHWDNTSCSASVAAPREANEVLPQIGPITCRRTR